MRLRNVKNKEILDKSPYLINKAKTYKGKWHTLFKNNHPIHLEIGCGKAKFIKDKALNNKDINYLAIEKFDSVMVRALETVDDLELDNLYFIKEDANNLLEFFDKDEIEKLYLNFSDPWPKRRHHKRRLTSKEFIDKYKALNIKIIEQKTDNRDLFEYSVKSFNNNKYIIEDISLDLHKDKDVEYTTEYEDKFIKNNKNIYFIKVKQVS